MSYFDSSKFRRDPSAKSISLFCQEPNIAISEGLIDALIDESEHGKRAARICLHNSPDSNFHEMIILEPHGHYFPPHKHIGKAQSCHVMRGSLAAFVFDDIGRIEHARILSRKYFSQGGDASLFRVGEGWNHLIMTLSDFVVYHEAKPGPFIPGGDAIFAPWAPARDDIEAAAAYLESLRKAITHS